MTIPGNLFTTAMAVMPHTDVEAALDLALSLDVPFWPQLPNYNYYEDMYVQASENFPGILLDLENKTLRFSIDKFYLEYEEMLANADNPEFYDISKTYSVVYHKFLEMDLADRPAIRGQLEGPVSFGFNVLDQNERPILFDDNVRPVMFEFMAKRINVQLARLKKINKNAFMFIDEPGLQFLWSAMAGYNDITAKKDLNNFFDMIDRPRGIHLCGNPDWQFLLGLDMDIVSLDVYTNGEVFKTYAKPLKDFFDRGGVISWGLVPTNFEPFEKEDMGTLEAKIEDIWDVLAKSGIDKEYLLSKSLLSPATCCLVNPDKEKTVEKAFKAVKELGDKLRKKYNL